MEQLSFGVVLTEVSQYHHITEFLSKFLEDKLCQPNIKFSHARSVDLEIDIIFTDQPYIDYDLLDLEWYYLSSPNDKFYGLDLQVISNYKLLGKSDCIPFVILDQGIDTSKVIKVSGYYLMESKEFLSHRYIVPIISSFSNGRYYRISRDIPLRDQLVRLEFMRLFSKSYKTVQGDESVREYLFEMPFSRSQVDMYMQKVDNGMMPIVELFNPMFTNCKTDHDMVSSIYSLIITYLKVTPINILHSLLMSSGKYVKCRVDGRVSLPISSYSHYVNIITHLSEVRSSRIVYKEFVGKDRHDLSQTLRILKRDNNSMILPFDRSIVAWYDNSFEKTDRENIDMGKLSSLREEYRDDILSGFGCSEGLDTVILEKFNEMSLSELLKVVSYGSTDGKRTHCYLMSTINSLDEPSLDRGRSQVIKEPLTKDEIPWTVRRYSLLVDSLVRGYLDIVPGLVDVDEIPDELLLTPWGANYRLVTGKSSKISLSIVQEE